MYARYETAASQSEGAGQQLAAISSLIKGQQVPYTDFVILEPCGTRMKKETRFHGLILNRSGELSQSEDFGLSSIATWKAGYGVFINAMVMQDAADLGPLLQ